MNTFLVSFVLFCAGAAGAADPMPAASPDKVLAKPTESLEQEYAKLNAACEECTIGHKAVSQSKGCAAKCAKAKKVRLKLESIKQNAQK